MIETPGVRPLVIGVGNRDRGDDAVGPLVADVFADRNDVETFVAEGDLSDLALRWEGHQRVVIVDAMASGRPPGTITLIDALDERLPVDGGLVSSHGIGVAESIELARLLGRLPLQLTIIAVEAAAFAQFDSLTPHVAASIPLVVERVEQVVGIEQVTEVHGARTVAV